MVNDGRIIRQEWETTPLTGPGGELLVRTRGTVTTACDPRGLLPRACPPCRRGFRRLRESVTPNMPSRQLHVEALDQHDGVEVAS